MKQNCMRSLSALFVCILLLSCVFSLPVHAADVDTAAAASVTMNFPAEFAGAEIRVYKVADVDANGHFTLTGSFAASGIDPNKSLADGRNEEQIASSWQEDTVTLQNLVITSDGAIAPTTQVKLEGPSVTVSGLPVGLYLILMDDVLTEFQVYHIQPTLLALPQNAQTPGEWSYNVTIQPKYTVNQRDDLIDIHVLKVWKDSKNQDKLRPPYITINLMQGAKVYETVVLSQENDWSYVWTGLSPIHHWSIMETDIPRGYTCKITQEGYEFIVTNSHHVDKQPGRLYQTGQLWWPIPVLICAGLVFLAVGVVIRRKEDHNG